METKLTLSISEARARLPELAQRVTDSPSEVIIIEHRNRKQRLVLASESQLLLLEAMVEKLKRQNPPSGFKLKGSMWSDLTDEEMEAAIAADRQTQAALREEKRRKFLEE